MKFLKKLQTKDVPIGPIVAGIDLSKEGSFVAIDAVNTGYTTLQLADPQPVKITLKMALDTLVEHGFHMKTIDLHTGYDVQAYPTIELNMQICPPPGKHAEVLSTLHQWIGSKMYGGKL